MYAVSSTADGAHRMSRCLVVGVRFAMRCPVRDTRPASSETSPTESHPSREVGPDAERKQPSQVASGVVLREFFKLGDCRRLFLAENSRGDSPDALRIGNCIDLNDLAISDGEAHNGKGLSTYRDHDPGRSIH